MEDGEPAGHDGRGTLTSYRDGWIVMAATRWIPETLFDELGFRMTYQVERVLYEMQTKHQHLVLFQSKRLREFESR